MGKPKRQSITEADLRAALKTLNKFLDQRAGVTHKDAAAANKTISAFARQRESEVREEAKRLGIKGDPVQRLLKELTKG